MKSLFILIALALTSLVAAHAQAKPLAYIYFGPGICDGCQTDLADIIKDAGFKILPVYPGQLTPEFLAKAALLAVPGGDLEATVYNSLKTGEAENIKQFVENGGRYLGVCLGAYLAAPKRSSLPGIDVFSGFIYAHSRNTLARMENITWKDKKTRWVYFQDGPEFEPAEGSKTEVWANYDDGSIAALQQALGKGKVGLMGPHLEADSYWWKDDGLVDPDGEDADLLVQFVKALAK